MYTKLFFDFQNQSEHLNAKSVLRSIKIVYFSLILGILFFLGVTFLVTEKHKFAYDKNDPILFACLILSMIAIPAGLLVSQAIWRKIDAGIPVKDKLLKYQPGFLVRIATCEGAAMFSIVGFLISGNLIYLVMTAAALLIIFYYYPSNEKLESQISLNQNELEELQNNYK